MDKSQQAGRRHENKPAVFLLLCWCKAGSWREIRGKSKKHTLYTLSCASVPSKPRHALPSALA